MSSSTAGINTEFKHPIFGYYSEDKSFGSKTKFLILTITFLNSQILFVRGANPFGTHFVQEFYILFLVTYFSIFLLRRSGVINKFDGFVATIPFLIVGLSAAYAFLEYRQPIFYGVFEARVTLMTLAFFPLYHLVRNEKHRLVFFLNANVVMFLLVFAIGMAVKLGLTSISTLYNFGTSDLALRGDIESAEALRGDRLSTARYIIVFSAIYSISMTIFSTSLRWGLLSILSLAHVAFVLQERQSIVGVAVVIIFLVFSGLLQKRVKKSVLYSLFGMILIVALGLATPGFFGSLFQLFDATRSIDLETFARFQTALTMIENMKLFIGHGALSLLWQDGFHRIYSHGFFIGDAGILGTAFRLGLVPAIVIMLFSLWYIAKRVGKVSEPNARKFLWALVIYLIVTSPAIAPFEYTGNYLAIILLIVACLRQQMLKRSPVSLRIIGRGL